LLLILFFFQERLLFFPQRISLDRNDSLRSRNDTEELELPMSDGMTMRGWLVKKAPHTPLKLLFYYGGNAEEVSRMVEESGKFGGYSMVLVNYRGYGKSDGKPGEETLKRDALEIFDVISKRPDVDATNTVLMGRSLGTGIAVYVAASRSHAGVILVSPYDSMANVAKRHYPFFPVDLLLRHRFESVRLAPAIISPVLLLVASEDSIVPKSHSQALAEYWSGKVDYCEVGRADHNTIDLHPLYWKAIQNFLSRIAADKLP
jgi:pimeloyl-ACP methyl ester carboxylesterase